MSLFVTGLPPESARREAPSHTQTQIEARFQELAAHYPTVRLMSTLEGPTADRAYVTLSWQQDNQQHGVILDVSGLSGSELREYLSKLHTEETGHVAIMHGTNVEQARAAGLPLTRPGAITDAPAPPKDPASWVFSTRDARHREITVRLDPYTIEMNVGEGFANIMDASGTVWQVAFNHVGEPTRLLTFNAEAEEDPVELSVTELPLPWEEVLAAVRAKLTKQRERAHQGPTGSNSVREISASGKGVDSVPIDTLDKHLMPAPDRQSSLHWSEACQRVGMQVRRFGESRSHPSALRSVPIPEDLRSALDGLEVKQHLVVTWQAERHLVVHLTLTEDGEAFIPQTGRRIRGVEVGVVHLVRTQDLKLPE